MIMPVSNRTVPLGFTRDGRFFYGEAKGGSDIYGVTLDAATGKVLGSPERIIDRFEGFNLSPSYSPDGEYLAYCSWRGSHRSLGGGAVGIHGNVLCIRSMVTGEDQEFSKAFSALGIDSITGPRWAPDGKSILVYGYAEPMGGYGGIYVVDLQRGNATRVTYSSEDVKVRNGEWLSDSKTIVFFRWDMKKRLVRLVARNLETGDERIVREFPESARPTLAVSPDYQRWCITTAEGDERVFWITNATGGEPRRLQGAPGFRDVGSRRQAHSVHEESSGREMAAVESVRRPRGPRASRPVGVFFHCPTERQPRRTARRVLARPTGRRGGLGDGEPGARGQGAGGGAANEEVGGHRRHGYRGLRWSGTATTQPSIHSQILHTQRAR